MVETTRQPYAPSGLGVKEPATGGGHLTPRSGLDLLAAVEHRLGNLGDGGVHLGQDLAPPLGQMPREGAVEEEPEPGARLPADRPHAPGCPPRSRSLHASAKKPPGASNRTKSASSPPPPHRQRSHASPIHASGSTTTPPTSFEGVYTCLEGR